MQNPAFPISGVGSADHRINNVVVVDKLLAIYSIHKWFADHTAVHLSGGRHRVFRMYRPREVGIQFDLVGKGS